MMNWDTATKTAELLTLCIEPMFTVTCTFEHGDEPGVFRVRVTWGDGQTTPHADYVDGFDDIVPILRAVRERYDQAQRHPDLFDEEPLPPITTEQLQVMLCLVGIEPSVAEMESWSTEQRTEAEAWAGAVHLSASDNDDVVVPLKPRWLPAAQRDNQSLYALQDYQSSRGYPPD